MTPESPESILWREVYVAALREGAKTPEDFANAALIVRAVNSHEALVRLLDAVEQWSGADPMVKGECFREVCERATQARAALALAEQG